MSAPGDGGYASGRPADERAEELVDRVSRDVGRFLARMGARAREEAEDIWAEAQDLRHGRGEPGAGRSE